MLRVTVARSFSDGNAIRDVFPVLWMTSRFHVIKRMGRIRHDTCLWSSSLDGGTGGKVCRRRLHLVIVAGRLRCQ